MTREDKIKAFAMRLDGKSLQEIGDQFGVSRERIRQILSETEGNKKYPRCVFPALLDWMTKSGIHGYALNKQLGLWGNAFCLYNRLSGKTPFTLPEIKRVLAVTGMTFEEAFGEQE